MAQVYRKQDVIAVRAVATSAVRDASNQHEFLARAARSAWGVRWKLFPGQEEARLDSLGRAGRWPQTGKRVLIIDVGGGSAELILSDHGVIEEAFSKPLGAVRLTEVFLKAIRPRRWSCIACTNTSRRSWRRRCAGSALAPSTA